MTRIQPTPKTASGVASFCIAVLAALTGAAQEAATLPVLKEGPWQGQHAVYEGRNFRALVDAGGNLSLQCLENGNPVGKPFSCLRLSCYYRTPKKVHEQPRSVVRFDAPPAPAVQPAKILLQGVLSDDVQFKLEYEFRNNEIIAAGGCVDPQGIKYPTQFRLNTDLGPNWDIAPAVPQDERKRTLAGCHLILKENLNGRTVRSKNPYWEVMRFRGSIQEAEIEGVFGSRTVTLSPKGNSSMSGWLFWGYCPWQGYTIFWHGPNGSLALKEKAVLSVE